MPKALKADRLKAPPISAQVAGRKPKRLRVALLLAVGVSIAASVWLLWTPAGSTLPALPDLSGKNAMLKNLLLEADSEARRTGTAAAVGKLARCYQANLFFSEAARCYALAELKAPTDASWPYLHAVALQSLGGSEGVPELLHRVISLESSNIPALLRLAELELKLERHADARGHFERVLALSKDNAFAHLGLARLAMATKDWGTARVSLEKAIAADPRFDDAYRLLTAVYQQLGQTDAAAKATATANARGRIREFADPQVESLAELCYDPDHLLAAEVTRVMDPQRAGEWRVDMLRRVVQCVPTHAEAHLYLGQALGQPATMSEAGKHLQEAVRLDPRSAWARCMFANWLIAQGRLERADEQFQAAMELDPGSHQTKLMVAKLRLQQDRLEEAADLFRQGLQADDRVRIPMLRLYVHTLELLDRKSEAVAFVEQLIKRHPSIGALWEYLSDAAALEGRWEDAEAMLRRGLTAAPFNAVIAERLAWRLATSPIATPESGQEAVNWALVAMETGDPQEASCHPDLALAAGFARAGDFAQALSVAHKARSALQSAGDKQTMEELEKQLKQYAAGQPYTEK